MNPLQLARRVPRRQPMAGRLWTTVVINLGLLGAAFAGSATAYARLRAEEATAGSRPGTLPGRPPV